MLFIVPHNSSVHAIGHFLVARYSIHFNSLGNCGHVSGDEISIITVSHNNNPGISEELSGIIPSFLVFHLEDKIIISKSG